MLQPIIPRTALLTFYKSFLRPNLDYGYVIYDRAFSESFQSKLESVRYNVALAITRAIKGSSREKLYQDIIPKVLSTRTNRNHNNIPLSNVKHEYFRNSFFPPTVIEGNKLDNNI